MKQMMNHIRKKILNIKKKLSKIQLSLWILFRKKRILNAILPQNKLNMTKERLKKP